MTFEKKWNVCQAMLEKLASENYVPSQGHMEKDVFAPNELKVR